MTDGSTPEIGTHSGIEAYQKTSLEDFRKKFSSQTIAPEHFNSPIGFFTTNECDYPLSLNEIKVRGGLHLAVMGGLDPVLGQIATADPDLAIIMDINNRAIDTTIEGRISTLETSESGEEYWNKVKEYHTNVIRKVEPKHYFPDNEEINEYRDRWSNETNYPQAKKALKDGRIKFVSGDITKDGLDLARKIAKETDIPLRLIYLSDIFDYASNNVLSFKKRLMQGMNEGWIDKEGQIIEAVGFHTKRVLRIAEYLNDYYGGAY